jgi:hypothetical protein
LLEDDRESQPRSRFCRRSTSRIKTTWYTCRHDTRLHSVQAAQIAGSGCVFSHSARAVVVGSIPAFSHQAASSAERWTSRWCPRQSGIVNSSLTLRPSARDCANRR